MYFATCKDQISSFCLLIQSKLVLIFIFLELTSSLCFKNFVFKDFNATYVFRGKGANTLLENLTDNAIAKLYATFSVVKKVEKEENLVA